MPGYPIGLPFESEDFFVARCRMCKTSSEQTITPLVQALAPQSRPMTKYGLGLAQRKTKEFWKMKFVGDFKYP